MNLRFGMMFSLGMITFTEDESGLKLNPLSAWRPKNRFNVDDWLDFAVDCGARYVIFTTTTGDGFALWPTKVHTPGFEPFSIAQTPWYETYEQDLVGEFIRKAHDRNLYVVLYYGGPVDLKWTDETGRLPHEDVTSFKARFEAKLGELLTNYGRVDAVYIDGWSYTGMMQLIPYDVIADYIHSIQPWCLVINNGSTVHPDATGPIEEYESNPPPFWQTLNPPLTENRRLAETQVTILASDPTHVYWYYHGENCAPGLQDPGYIAQAMNLAAYPGYTKRYTFTLGLAVGPDGEIPECQKDAVTAALAARSMYSETGNLALLSLTKSSSVAAPGGLPIDTYQPKWATDGVFETYTSYAQFTSAPGDMNPYLEVDLRGEALISRVDVWNARPGSTNRGWFRDLTVQVYDASRELVYMSSSLNVNNESGGGWDDYITGPSRVSAGGFAVTGRYVRVTRKGTGGFPWEHQLVVSEVAVFGPPFDSTSSAAPVRSSDSERASSAHVYGRPWSSEESIGTPQDEVWGEPGNNNGALEK